jgi:hypothetical protein
MTKLVVRSRSVSVRLALSIGVALGVAGCTVLDYAGLEGPGELTGLFAFDDVSGPNCAEGPGPEKPTLSDPLPESAANARVYLTRGLVAEYSLGMNRLADKLEELGIQTRVIDKPDYEDAQSEIVNTYQESGGTLQFFIIGHSWGSDDAIRIAAELDADDVPIRLVVVLDAGLPPGVSDNVEKCTCYYIPTPAGETAPFVFAGHPISLAPDNSRTVLDNIPFTTETYGDMVGCATHFNVDVNSFAHILIIDEIVGILRQ